MSKHTKQFDRYEQIAYKAQKDGRTIALFTKAKKPPSTNYGRTDYEKRLYDVEFCKAFNSIRLAYPLENLKGDTQTMATRTTKTVTPSNIPTKRNRAIEDIEEELQQEEEKKEPFTYSNNWDFTGKSNSVAYDGGNERYPNVSFFISVWTGGKGQDATYISARVTVWDGQEDADNYDEQHEQYERASDIKRGDRVQVIGFIKNIGEDNRGDAQLHVNASWVQVTQKASSLSKSYTPSKTARKQRK